MVAGSHLLDKLHRLLRLLAGNSVDVGNRQISVRCHPTALLFCKDLLAKGIVVCAVTLAVICLFRKNLSLKFFYGVYIIRNKTLKTRKCKIVKKT